MKWIVAMMVAALVGPSRGDTSLKLSDGDHVVFVGATLVERDQQYGWFETMLHARFPDAKFTFRNLGWSGDTVWGEARAEFGTQADGYKKLIDEVVAAKPTVLLLNYGTNEAFAGEAGVAKFIEQYNKLLEDLSKTGAKIWLVGPNRFVTLGVPLPDPALPNQDVKRYSQAIASLAAKRWCGFVDLFAAMPNARPQEISDDEMHFTSEGERQFAEAMVDVLTGKKAASKNAPAMDALRLATIEKNRQFFYRWRPQNDTYIFGFRKHEQGQNAVEIPKFDPIVQKMEEDISAMSKTLK